MKKRFLISAASCLAIASVFGQSKINLAGRMIIDSYKEIKSSASATDKASHQDEDYCVLVILKDGYNCDYLSSNGFNVITDLGTVATVTLPVSQIDELAELDGVQQVSFGETQYPQMDYARPSGYVNEVQDGFTYENSTLKYDGTGVLAGIMDGGLEANHLNFLDDSGTTRIKALWWFNKSQAGQATKYTGALIKSFTTDDNSSSHATHVGGIMAGSYNGNGDYCYVSTANGTRSTTIEDSPIPYYGVATGADLAFSVGSLYDANIINGVDNIISLAEQNGQPCVVNLSIGSTIGPHDGTDAYPKALSKLGEKAIICMSSGNDGDKAISVTKTLTETNTTLKTFFVDNKAIGIVDVWVSDNVPVKFRWVLYDETTEAITDLLVIDEATSTKTVYTSTDSEFAKSFTGSISSVSDVDNSNNRYHIYSNLAVTPISSNSDILLALIIEGTAGQKINVYGQSGTNTQTLFTSNMIAGWDEGSADNSINDGCCADNIVSVGAYTSRSSFGMFKNTAAYSYVGASSVNSIAPFSSWGTSFSGKQLPDVCAPGTAIISSISRYYISAGYSSENDMSGKAANGSETDYWGPMQGTSMSCPYVSGTVALWLQANPNLTYSQVIDVISNTSKYSSITMRPKERWGAGKIDALEGIKYVLQNYAANGAVWEDDEQRLVVTPNGAGYDVTMAGEASFTVTVYDMQGRPLTTVRGIDGQASVGTTELSAGIYVLAAQGASSRLTRKITVR